MEWSLEVLLSRLHDDIERLLETARESMGHPVELGDASESVWLDLLNTYLPKRYEAKKATIVDSNGTFSEQIDVVVFDRQYSPFIFVFKNQTVIPAESVYAAFEAKQSLNAHNVGYAQKKIASVRQLHRTSLPIPHAGGIYKSKPLTPILGGLLTFASDWTPAMGAPFESALQLNLEEGRLDLGCVASHGHYRYDTASNTYICTAGGKPATAFLFNLISQLQAAGTVPMIDVLAYGRWLET